MITTLTGKNSYGLQKRLKELAAGFIAKHSDLALERIEAAQAETQAIIEAAQALPFLAERRLIIIRDLSQNKPAAETIEQIISSVSDSTDLVIVEPDLDRRTAYFKVLKNQTQFEEFNELDAGGLTRWLVDEAKRQSGGLTQNDAAYMVSRLGSNQALLASELDKLITYDPTISRQNIDLLTEANPQSRVFDLLDAAFNRDKERALRLYEEQRAQRVEPQAILAMLAWQLRLLAIAKNMDGRSSGEVSKETGLSEYPLRKARDLAGKLDDDQLKEMVSEALVIDVRSKTSAMDLDEALKTYIATL